MTEYLPIRPMEGDESEEIESLPSFFARAARHHSVSLLQFAKHLEDWWNHTHRNQVTLPLGQLYARGAPLCGFGPNVDDYVRVLTEAMGVPNLQRTTLCGLRLAAARYGQKTVKSSRAWCPACMHERLSSGEHFDSLLWAIMPQTRCHIHRLKLIMHCPSCQALQIPMHRSGQLHLCWRCEQTLVPHWRNWTLQLEPSFGERDCIELVRAISTGSFVEACPDALQVFCIELRELMASVFKPQLNMRGKVERVRVLGRENQPTLLTMLRQAQVSGVSLLDILSVPKWAARIAGELECVRRDYPAQCRPRKPQEIGRLVEQEIRRALARTEKVESFTALAKRLGVSTGYVRYRLPALAKKYIAHWTACRNRANSIRDSKIIELLKSELLPLYNSGSIRSQDDLVDAIVQRLRVGKRTARIAVYAMTSRSCAADDL